MRGKWGSLVVLGILGIAAGVVTFLWPGITAITLLWVIAFWAIVAGVLQISAAIRLRKEVAGRVALDPLGPRARSRSARC